MKFATRPSALARWQTRWVMDALQRLHPDLECQETVIMTTGDRILDRPLPEIGGKGLFTQELESELLEGRLDAAVHSLKDLPIEDSLGLVLAAVPQRAEARDALVSPRGWTLDSLPKGAVVGTSSLRRSAQILALRPDLNIQSLRGNVDTRLRKVLEGQYDVIVLASAGMQRLGLEDHISQLLPFEVMLPAPGQGALAVQARRDDRLTLEDLSALEDRPTRLAVTAERAFLSGLGGGCSVPVAAYARFENEHIKMDGLVASPDGKQVIRVHGSGDDPHLLGSNLALQAVEQGARSLLVLPGSPFAQEGRV